MSDRVEMKLITDHAEEVFGLVKAMRERGYNYPYIVKALRTKHRFFWRPGYKVTCPIISKFMIDRGYRVKPMCARPRLGKKKLRDMTEQELIERKRIYQQRWRAKKELAKLKGTQQQLTIDGVAPTFMIPEQRPVWNPPVETTFSGGPAVQATPVQEPTRLLEAATTRAIQSILNSPITAEVKVQIIQALVRT
jgi:hypothetical protein